MSIRDEIGEALDDHWHIYASYEGEDLGCACNGYAYGEGTGNDTFRRHLLEVLLPIIDAHAAALDGGKE